MHCRPHIRPMVAADWEEVSAIYAAGIASGISTCEAEVPSYEVWDERHLQCCRLVVELEGRVAGFAVLAPVSVRHCYRGVAELSIYLAEFARGKGVGAALLSRLIELSEQEGYWSLLAVVYPENQKSLALHARCGFRVIGLRERIGHLADGSFQDMMMLERRSATVGV